MVPPSNDLDCDRKLSLPGPKVIATTPSRTRSTNDQILRKPLWQNTLLHGDVVDWDATYGERELSA